MKKRLVALVMAMMLLLSLCAVAHADYETFDCVLLKSVTLTSSELTENNVIRAAIAASVMLEYLFEHVDTLETTMNSFTSSGYGYVAKYGSCVDVYLRLKTGNYLNLFYSPNLKTITVYGTVSSIPSNSEYTYNSVSMSDIDSALSSLIETLNK